MARCLKCNGAGVIPAYLHVKAGRCFRCNGTGRVREGRRDNVLYAIDTASSDGPVLIGAFNECSRLAYRLATDVGDKAVVRRATESETARHNWSHRL